MRKVLAGVSKLVISGLVYVIDFPTKSCSYIKVNGYGAYFLLIAGVFVKHREAILFEKNLSEVPELIHPKIVVDVRMGRDNDIPKLRRLLPWCSARDFRNRLSRGDVFFVAQVGEEIIHQIWISFKYNYIALLDREIILEEGEADIYHVYTAPEFRGNLVYTAVKRKVLRYLKNRGCKRCFFVVNLKANQLTKAYEEISSTHKGTIISYWRILGYRKYRHKPYRGVK